MQLIRILFNNNTIMSIPKDVMDYIVGDSDLGVPRPGRFTTNEVFEVFSKRRMDIATFELPKLKRNVSTIDKARKHSIAQMALGATLYMMSAVDEEKVFGGFDYNEPSWQFLM